ncbi:Mss4-like protein [Bombardia bombarda]|uniref:Mss4-like protein n=1 Tax=Bombardia bombarda TaxID=252184 RepID=A0AA39XM27_9PEZI|nr:Mss4-like protein [Bombardia bombarda]
MSPQVLFYTVETVHDKNQKDRQTIMTSTLTFPTPKTITGGCLCGGLRYLVEFPIDHDFRAGSETCQCTQCRKQTGGLFLVSHRVSTAAFRFTGSHATLRQFNATPNVDRAFCSDCGSLIYWRPKDKSYLCFTVGTVDPLYLIGEGHPEGVASTARGSGAAGGDKASQPETESVPEGGYGMALANGCGRHYWCKNEIKGVTDGIPLLGMGGRGTRCLGDY